MTTHQQTTDADAGTEPVACSLTPTDLDKQSSRWERLAARALTERAETEHGLRLSFRPEAEDDLRALVAVETECCQWATWTVERTAGTVMLDVSSSAEGVTVLHGMFR